MKRAWRRRTAPCSVRSERDVRCRAVQWGHVVEIALPSIEGRDDREGMMRSDPLRGDGHAAKRRDVHVRHQQTEARRAGIDRTDDRHADHCAEIAFHATYFVARKAE